MFEELKGGWWWLGVVWREHGKRRGREVQYEHDGSGVEKGAVEKSIRGRAGVHD